MASKPNAPQYGVDNLYLFPVYQTRDQYRAATGQEPPPFDPTKPEKGWSDPNPPTSGKFVAIYPRVISWDANGTNANVGPDGKPFFEPLVLPIDWAKSVNIAAKAAANEPGTGVAVIPCPCRALDADEELALGSFGVPVVRNTALWQQATSAPTSFLESDRQLLKAIAAKVGV